MSLNKKNTTHDDVKKLKNIKNMKKKKIGLCFALEQMFVKIQIEQYSIKYIRKTTHYLTNTPYMAFHHMHIIKMITYSTDTLC